MRSSDRVTGGQPDERADLDVIRADAVTRAVEWRAAVHGHLVRPDALDRAPHGVEEVREVLHVRLGCGVAAAPVVPRASTAAAIAFSVPVTLGSSRKTSAPRSSVASIAMTSVSV
jgi:hypothetical protein